MKELKHGKNYVCKRLKLLEYLLKEGFEPVKTIPDADNWKFKNWIFVNSVELEDALASYFMQFQK